MQSSSHPFIYAQKPSARPFRFSRMCKMILMLASPGPAGLNRDLVNTLMISGALVSSTEVTIHVWLLFLRTHPSFFPIPQGYAHISLALPQLAI
jgi:hypothetical protein